MESLPQNPEPTPAQYENKVKHSAKYTSCDCFITVLSLLVYIADIITDIILSVKYLKAGYFEWGALTLMLFIVPNALIQAISLRWHIVDQTEISLPIAFSHFTFLGVVHRYGTILGLGFQSQHVVGPTNQAFQLLCHYQSDLCLLRLFESFLESAPQLLLQLYVMHELGSWDLWTGISAIGSLLSLAWGIASYARTMRNSREDKAGITWIGLALQAMWRAGTMVSRIMALLVCASVIHLWFLLAITIHWFGMTIWTIKQNTDLCSTAWEERIYNCVVGVVYCFCFFNIKEGHSRQRTIIFYTVTAAENAACLVIFLQFSHDHSENVWFHTTAPVLIVVGSFLGHASQLVYYRWFHPSGPIEFQPSNNFRIQENSEVGRIPPGQSVPEFSPVFSVRTLKNMNRKFSGVSLASTVVEPVIIASVKLDVTENPALENKNPAQDTVVEEANMEISGMHHAEHVAKSFRQLTIKSYSDSRLEIPPSHSVPTETLMIKTKSEGHFQLNAISVPVKPIRLSILVNEAYSQTSETSTYSVHDYENLAFLNVNRTDWGIRHWKSYSDIETSFHDNSVCKVRDPLESSITSASSNDSSRILATGKLSIEEAIAQLKSFAAHGHNEYQPDSNATKLYEFIWTNDNEVSVVAPVKPCPSTGHNLSIITEVSESNSTSSTRSKSSLVQTVDAIMDRSACESAENNHLTYVEVSFLSKLSDSSMDSDKTVEHHSEENKMPARRKFSIIRDKFECRPSQLAKQCPRLQVLNKENVPGLLFSTTKSQDSASPGRQPHQSLLRKQSTLSPESRIFSQSSFNC